MGEHKTFIFFFFLSFKRLPTPYSGGIRSHDPELHSSQR
jgi:hypothetical protein